jgi:HPt (histidine-containing phosphotransfer) domain-containing protein
LPELVGSIEGAVTAGDPARLAAASHTLKGGCRTLGAEALGAVCEELEGLAARSDLAAARTAITRATAEIDRLRATVHARLAETARE